MSKELEQFRRIAGDPGFRQWLEAEIKSTTKCLVMSEGTGLFRAQGRVKLLEEILERLDKAAQLR